MADISTSSSPCTKQALPFQGLTAAEVAESRRLHGANTLPPPVRTPWWKQLLGKFDDPCIRILSLAAIISLLTGSFVEGAGILIAIILATVIGFVNEFQAEKEFDILNKTNEQVPVNVIRDGNFHQIPKADVVVGDIVLVELGEEVPADGIVVDAMNLQVDQSRLTGESDPVHKFTEAQIASGVKAEASTYPATLLLKGTPVVEGHGIIQVTGVGPNTEIGRTAQAATVETGDETPLNRQLARLGSVLGVVSISLAIILFAALLFKNHPASWAAAFTAGASYRMYLEYLMLALALVVMAMPEGLAMSVTLSLAYSMRKMTATNNLVRKMHACETIGAATVICTDKTGTLTMNKMVVQHVEFPDSSMDFISAAIAANSTAHLAKATSPDTLPEAIGNPTECALLLWLHQKGIDIEATRAQFSITNQWTFSTERKFMATAGHSVATSNQETLFAKGAPEIILSRCSSILEKGISSPLTEEKKKEILAQLLSYQARGMRTLGFAWKTNPDLSSGDLLQVAQELCWMGFAAIADPVRPDVPDAIASCFRAGIQVKMVTGDNPETAKEIGRQIHLWDENHESPYCVMTGPAFSALPEDEAARAAKELRVMARARPTDKLRLVRLLKNQGEVVAVTGDGTNDAPALNFADVGIAMGKTGTAIAKEAADIILLDDSFPSIVNAVMWGRSLYRNIQKFIQFQLTVNVAACTIAILGPLMGKMTEPLTVIQILWVNLIMDTLAALALATDPPDPRVMQKPPRKNSDFIVTPKMWAGIFTAAIAFLAILGSMLYYINSNNLIEEIRWQTIFFTTLILLQFWNLFNAKCIGTSDSFFKHLIDNKSFTAIASSILIIQIIIVCFGGKVFRTIPLSLLDWLCIIGGTSTIAWCGEIYRLLRKK